MKFIVEQSNGHVFEELAEFTSPEAAIKCAEAMRGKVRVHCKETWEVIYSHDATRKRVLESVGVQYEPNFLKASPNHPWKFLALQLAEDEKYMADAEAADEKRLGMRGDE